jgi:hypothetical protein
MKPMKGTTPVPGPIIIIGVFSGANTNADDLMNPLTTAFSAG